MELRVSCSRAPPLKRPKGAASVTIPLAALPTGITTLPSACTGWATVALKVSPLLLILDPTERPKRTVMMVPAGSATGLFVSRSIKPGLAAVVVLPPLVSVEGCSAGLPQPESMIIRDTIKKNVKRVRITPPFHSAGFYQNQPGCNPPWRLAKKLTLVSRSGCHGGLGGRFLQFDDLCSRTIFLAIHTCAHKFAGV